MTNLQQSKQYEAFVRTVQDFPKKGIEFYDISPLLANPGIFSELIANMSDPLRGKVDKLAAFDARGFLFAGAMAAELGIGFIMLRKPGKLPGDVLQKKYNLEYGTNALEVQKNMLELGERVGLVDDVVATGGTALAGVDLVRSCGAIVEHFATVIDLPNLSGSQKINEAGVAVHAMMKLRGTQ